MRRFIGSNIGTSFIITVLVFSLASCADAQPPYECAAQNMATYQLRYYLLKTECDKDTRFTTNALAGGTATMQTYKLVSKDGGGNTGGLDVVFQDETIKLDLSATKLGIRLGTMLTLTTPSACNDDPNSDAGTSDIIRDADKPTSAPDFLLKLPRFSTNGICSSLPDSGTATANSNFPEYTCQDNTVLPKVTIKAILTNYKLASSASILGGIAKANVSFTETVGSASCTSDYKLILMTPQITCYTDYDCSPDPIPSAPRCGKNPSSSDFCLTWQAASTTTGSGLTPYFFSRLADGGYDFKGVCDTNQNICIWDADAGL